MTGAGPSPRIVTCPTCKGPSRFAPDNPWRPFCSERCRAIDLGAWASESYRVDASTQPEGDDPSDQQSRAH
jgi:endogenous inhibitor of DNA gyrase (YacG/DUF329 family)